MGNLSGWVLFVILIVLVCINLFIYHRLFPVRIYVGNPFKVMLRNLFGAIVVGLVEIAVGQLLLGGIFSLLGGVLSAVAGGALFLLRIIIFLLVAAVLIFAVYMLARYIKGKLPSQSGESDTTVSEAAESLKNRASDITNKVKEKAKEVQEDAGSKRKAKASESGTADSQKTADGRTGQQTAASSEKGTAPEASSGTRDEMICPNCGQKIAKGSKFCIHCGEQVPGTRICPSCGREISATVKFCNFCGTKLADVENASQNSADTTSAISEDSTEDYMGSGTSTESAGQTFATVEELEKYITDNFNAETKVQAIKFYRQHTGQGLKEAKDKIDILLQSTN